MASRFTLVGSACLGLAVGGCAESNTVPTPPPPPPAPSYTVPSTAWAGAPLVVSSSLPFEADVVTQVEIAGQMLELQPITSTTRSALLPVDIPGGATPATLHAGGLHVPLGNILVAGHLDGHRFDVLVSHDAYAWPRDGAASVLAQNSEGLVVYDLDASTMAVVPVPSESNLYGPGATPDPDVFVVRNDNGVESWRLRPTVSRVATFPELAGRPTRHVMLMSATAMLYSPHQHQHDIWTRSSEQEPFTPTLEMLDAEETRGVYLSPRGDRATIRVAGDEAGVSVFDAVTGTIAYRMPLRSSDGVDFSPAGDRLVMGGSDMVDFRNLHHVLVVDPDDGEVLAEASFPLPIAAVAWDASRPYVYVALADESRGPRLLVLDQSTLETLAEMRPPGIVESPTSCCHNAVIAPSRTSDTVHLFWQRWSHRFALPPE